MFADYSFVHVQWIAREFIDLGHRWLRCLPDALMGLSRGLNQRWLRQWNRHQWEISKHFLIISVCECTWKQIFKLPTFCPCYHTLTHSDRVTLICVGKLTIIDSDNGLSPGRRQAIIWTNAGILLIGPWGIHFNEFLIGIQTFSFKKVHLKMSSAKWRPFCLGLNVLSSDVSGLMSVDVTWLQCWRKLLLSSASRFGVRMPTVKSPI